jgi:hypothetical protein
VSNLKRVDFDPVMAIHMPLSERVLDRLADIMFASDEVLDMIRTSRFADESTVEIEHSVRSVYNQVNELMKKLTD